MISDTMSGIPSTNRMLGMSGNGRSARFDQGIIMKPAKATMDRRIPRTRAMLQHALTSLILKKGYDAITIQDICDKANVGRSTFYAHYTSKDDLKRSGFAHLRKELIDRQRDALAMPGDIRDRSL